MMLPKKINELSLYENIRENGLILYNCKLDLPNKMSQFIAVK